MGYDADQLQKNLAFFLKGQGYREEPCRGFLSDGAWVRDSEGILFVEAKSELESLDPPGTWWNYPADDLDGQRSHINNQYHSSVRNDSPQVHQYKWMVVLAQLRNAIKKVKKLAIPYRSAIVLPQVETANFRCGFQIYHNDPQLSLAAGRPVSLRPWYEQFHYVDRRQIPIQVCLIEIALDNYFGWFWD